MAARQSAPVLGAMCNAGEMPDRAEATARPGRWEVSFGYRYQKSFRHFVGTVEQKHREEEDSAIVNRIHLFDVGISYQLTRRWSLHGSVPFLRATRLRPRELDLPNFPNAPDQIFRAAGLGDISVGARAWLFRPPTEGHGNIAIGISAKFPTGNPGVINTVETATGPRTRPVDQSIQPGDGGYGFALDVQAFKSFDRWTAFFTGTYLFNPQATNGVQTFRSRPSEAIMSIPDQYLYRGGIGYAVPGVRGLAVNVAGRIEGVKVTDAIGSSEGFRRPGYTLSVEPGFIYASGPNTWSMSIPVAVRRNRKRSVADIRDGRHGDAAFADYLITFGYARRF